MKIAYIRASLCGIWPHIKRERMMPSALPLTLPFRWQIAAA